MTTIAQVAQALQELLGARATELERTSGFVQRTSKLTGSAFLQTLVFGWLANPEATLEELSQVAVLLGVAITSQGLDQRFTPQAAEFLKQVLAAAVQAVVASEPMALPVLQRFAGVYLLDGTTVTLPEALAEVWDGGGCPAALKVQVGLEMRTGQLLGPLLQAARDQDRTTPLQEAELPVGALRLADLGYFDLQRLQSLSVQRAFWLTRLQAGTLVFTPDGQRQDLLALLEAQRSNTVDLSVEVGVKQRLSCRLIAQRVPAEVAEERRRKLRAAARHKGQTVSQQRLRLAGWTYYITNVPVELLSPAEALVLARVRWQIELLFKLWKSQGCIDHWRSAKPWRILCEVYAKLVAVLVQHWTLLLGCWMRVDHSLWKAARTIRHLALYLAAHFAEPLACEDALRTLARVLAAGCRINKRKTKPHTYQLLIALCEEA